MSKLRILFAVAALPVMVTIAFPVLIIGYSGKNDLGKIFVVHLGIPFFMGMLVICIGLYLLVSTIIQFALSGKGTLAPWDPPKFLIIEGIYRHVRNPMISGVIMIILGEALIFRSANLFIYWLAVTLLNLVYIPLVEEKGLEKRFGEPYRLYKKNVPRWIPRLTPFRYH